MTMDVRWGATSHVIGAFLYITGLISCSAFNDTSDYCYKDLQRPCNTADCSGIQICGSNSRWLSCVCQAGSTGGGTSIIEGGMSGASGGSANAGVGGDGQLKTIGNSCASDAQCSPGATCLTTASNLWLGGGPPEAICVADCSAGASTCDAFQDAVCVQSSVASQASLSRALCFSSCSLALGTSSIHSCAKTGQQACESLDTQGTVGFCRPYCVFDSDCAGFYCDRSLGVCTSIRRTASTELFGDACNPNSVNCAGVCLTFSSTSSICTHRCAFGSLADCNTGSETSTSAICGYASPYGDTGDLGYCSPLCNCNDDCKATGFVCRSFEDTALMEQAGHLGLCSPSVDSAGVIRTGIPCY
jgi:hypothetical protein